MMLSRGVGVSICCPGPIITQEGVTRNVFGPRGPIVDSKRITQKSSSHMQSHRVAELIIQAAYHKVDKCWIAKHPVLLIGAPLTTGTRQSTNQLIGQLVCQLNEGSSTQSIGQSIQ